MGVVAARAKRSIQMYLIIIGLILLHVSIIIDDQTIIIGLILLHVSIIIDDETTHIICVEW